MPKMRVVQVAKAGGPLEIVERDIPEPGRRTVRIKVQACGVRGWYSGTSIDSQDTLAFSVQSGVRSMNETFPLEKAAEAYERMMSGKARFRVVLTTGN